MRKLFILALLVAGASFLHAETIVFGKGTVKVKYVAKNAVRIQYSEGQKDSDLPDWLYVKHDEVAKPDVRVSADKSGQLLTVKDKKGRFRMAIAMFVVCRAD